MDAELKRYHAYLLLERSLSANTIEAYCSDVEKLFQYLADVGLSYRLVEHCQLQDFFMLLSCFYTLVSLTAAIVIDISYGFIDPRIRMGAK